MVQKDFHDLVVSTYGRGLYILDDITPLEQLARKHSDAAVELFEPRQTYRFSRAPQAMVNFNLKAAPKKPVEVEILDAHGAVVRKLEAKGQPGLNRVKWDMRYESPRLVALRTAAPDNPHIWNEPRFRDVDSRPITHWGSGPAEVGPIVAPGKYTVRLKVDGQSYTQSLTVVRDPKAPGTDADIDLSVKTLLQITDYISKVSDTVNQIEWLRKQLEVIQAMLRAPKKPEQDKAAVAEASDDDDYDGPEPTRAAAKALTEAQAKQRAQLLQAAEDLNKKLLAIEHRLVSQALMNSDDKYFVEPYQAYLNLIWLNAEVGTGGSDVAGGADFAPTETQLALLKQYVSDVNAVESDYHKLLAEDLPAFNRTIQGSNVAPLVTGGVPATGKKE